MFNGIMKLAQNCRLNNHKNSELNRAFNNFNKNDL